MDFPGKKHIQNPSVELRYQIEIEADPEAIWPWLLQLGYHRGGWYIDTWWDKFTQQYIWPRLVPEEARGTFGPPADRILPEYQQTALGDIIPDGPPDTAYYEVVGFKEHRLLLLYATTHFNYMAPRFIYKTKLAPKGAFCWAFIIEEEASERSRLTSWWQGEIYPQKVLFLLKPFLILVDGIHQRQILKGIKRRVEKMKTLS